MPHRNASEFYWAESLDDQLYLNRGSLTAAINLATAGFGSTTIKLVGVDLNSEKSFFAEELAETKRYYDPLHDPLAAQAEKHATAVQLPGIEPIQAVLPQVVEHLAGRGVELVCCSAGSLLCQEAICPYEPLLCG